MESEVLSGVPAPGPNTVAKRSRPRMTRFERARILSMRAEQIANGAIPFVERIEGDQPLDVAEREFAAGRVPFLIRRFVPTENGVMAEDWRLDELEPCDRRLGDVVTSDNLGKPFPGFLRFR